MKKSILICCAAASALFFQSCKIMYTPNMQNVPLMQEKNEVKATVGPSDLQAAYAVTENVGVMLNGQYKKPTWTWTAGNTAYKYESRKTLVEAGAGYSMKLGASGIFETYGGAGIGKVTYNRSYSDTSGGPTTTTDRYTASTTRFFIQPSVGVTNENVDFAFSTRIVGLKFSNIDTAGYTQDILLEEDLSNLNKPLYTFFEPALTLRVGYKYVKFHLQAIYSIKLNQDRLNYLPFSINFGAHINIAPRFKSE